MTCRLFAVSLALLSVSLRGPDTRQGTEPSEGLAADWNIREILAPPEWFRTKAASTPDENLQALAVLEMVDWPKADDARVSNDAKEELRRRVNALAAFDLWPLEAVSFAKFARAVPKIGERARAVADIRGFDWRVAFARGGLYFLIRGRDVDGQIRDLRVLCAYPREQAPPKTFADLKSSLARKSEEAPLSVEFGEYGPDGEPVYYRGLIYTLVGQPPKLPTAPASQPATRPATGAAR